MKWYIIEMLSDKSTIGVTPKKEVYQGKAYVFFAFTTREDLRRLVFTADLPNHGESFSPKFA